jgi:hypothetical protein
LGLNAARAFVAVALAASCRAAPPDLGALATSVARYEAGREALAAGDAVTAAAAFAEARSSRGDDPLLTQWHARALWRSGDTEQAESLLSGVLTRHPELMTARYDLGILKLDRGDLSGVDDVRAAVEAGVRSPASAARDPDLTPHLARLPFLPHVPLRLVFRVDPASARVGADVVVSAELFGILDAPWSLETPGGSGPVEVVYAAETVLDAGETRRLSWVLRAMSPGRVSLPAMVVRQGGAETAAVGGAYDVTSASPGAGSPAVAPIPLLALPLPSQDPTVLLPDARAGGDGWWVAWAADTRLIVEPASALPTFRSSLRVVGRDGTPLRAEERARFAAAPARVTVLRGALVEAQWPPPTTAR